MKKEVPFDGSFEDSDLEEEDEEEEEEESEEESVMKQRKRRDPKKKLTYPSNKIICNVFDTQYAVVKFVCKRLMRWKLQYENETYSWDVLWTDNAVQPEVLGKMQRKKRESGMD